MIRMLVRFVFVFSVSALLSACATPPRHRVPLYYDANNPLKRVAVLPMKNDTVDVGGPELVRKKMINALEDKSYIVKEVKETDQILRDQMGITLGGQLEMTTAQKLGEVLGVEGVLYGTLMDFDETTTGVVDVRKVRAMFRLVNTATGQAVWERGLGVRAETYLYGKSGSVAAAVTRAADARDKDVPWVTIDSTAASESNVGRAFAAEMGVKLLSKAIGIHLEHESDEMVKRITQSLPWGPGPGTAAPAIIVRKPPMPPLPVAQPALYGYYGYLDYGKQSMSAIMVSTTTDKNGKEIRLDMPFAKAGDKIRMDIDLSGAVEQPASMPAALAKLSVIHRGDTGTSFTLYPHTRKFMTSPIAGAASAEKPTIEKTKIGSELVNNHPSDKYKVKITYRDGLIQEGFLWAATDLDGMTIKSDVGNADGRVVTELMDIVLKTPPEGLFEIPADYTEAHTYMDLMTESK